MSAVGPALVVGGDGLIGRALAERLTRSGSDVSCTTRRAGLGKAPGFRLDLSEDPSAWRLPNPVSIAFLCAAITSLRACEDNPSGTAQVNVEHLSVLASTLAARGAFLVFLSTNLVFDGSVPYRSSTDPVCPRTEYGRQKTAMERKVLEIGGAVVRLTKVLGPRDPLSSDWIAKFRNGEPVEPFRDKVMAPVNLDLVVDVLTQVAADRVAGVTQVSASRDLSYVEAARLLCRNVGANESLIRPRESFEIGLPPSFTPAYTTLCTRRLTVDLGFEAPEPERLLEEMVNT